MADNDNNNNGNSGAPPAPLTPAEQIEIERLRAEQAKYKAEAEASSLRTIELQKANTELYRKDSLREAFRESGVKFHNQSDALTLLGEIEYDSENKPYVNGVPLAKAVQDLALANENLVDGRSIRSLKEKQVDKTPKSKGDLDQAGKIAFIAEKGLAAFEALPNKRPVALSGRMPTREEWKHMSVTQKTSVVAQHGSSIVFKITRGEFDSRQ